MERDPGLVPGFRLAQCVFCVTEQSVELEADDVAPDHLPQELRSGRPPAEGNTGRHTFLTDQLGHFESRHAAIRPQALFLGVEREAELRLLDGGNSHMAERPFAVITFRHSAYP